MNSLNNFKNERDKEQSRVTIIHDDNNTNSNENDKIVTYPEIRGDIKKVRHTQPINESVESEKCAEVNKENVIPKKRVSERGTQTFHNSLQVSNHVH